MKISLSFTFKKNQVFLLNLIDFSNKFSGRYFSFCCGSSWAHFAIKWLITFVIVGLGLHPKNPKFDIPTFKKIT